MNAWLRAGLAIAAGLCVTDASAQPANPIDAYLKAAKEAAGFDFAGTLVRVCVVPQPLRSRRGSAPAAKPESWYTDPAKVFDNLYFVGTKFHSSWALTSSEEIILSTRFTTTPPRKRSSGALRARA